MWVSVGVSFGACKVTKQSVHSSGNPAWSLPEQDEANGLDSSSSDVIIHVTHLQ